MSYKIPELPSPKAYIEEKADFWEIQAIINKGINISQTDISKILSIQSDETNNDGINSEDDTIEVALFETFNHLNSRIQTCGFNRYPFDLATSSIKFSDETLTPHMWVYLYLLFCTRLNMKKNKIFNNLDGTKIFEHLCAQVLKNYFGENSNSIVFGTAEEGNFIDKVNELIKQLGEGNHFKNTNKNPPTKNDDSLDIVGWKDFKDKDRNKLIGFGQCKTGTSWQDYVNKLKSSDFCSNWFNDDPLFLPIDIFFIADTLNDEFNRNSIRRSKLFFNRFRIMEYLPEEIDNKTLKEIKDWVQGALDFLNQH